MDATANFARLSNYDSVQYYFNKCKAVGITDVVIDVKPISGEVLYPSKIAPILLEWNGLSRTKNFDLLSAALNIGHQLKLKVHASINIFCEGHNTYKRGLLFNQHPSWQTQLYTDTGIINILATQKVSGMLNPALPQVQAYELSIINEILTMYPLLDGLMLDRVRYDGIEADFSTASWQGFQKYVGNTITNWPTCIFKYQKENGKILKVPGAYYKQWLEWRASIIYTFIKDARQVAKKANPGIVFGDYTGAWYPTYYEVGANWASNSFDVVNAYPSWASTKYQQYGYAELLDLYSSGCYFYEVTKAEVAIKVAVSTSTEAGLHIAKEPWYSVQGSAEMAMAVTKNAAPLYASIYVAQYKNNEAQCIKAMQMCVAKSNGLMIFDMVHIVERNWWNAIKNLQNN